MYCEHLQWWIFYAKIFATQKTKGFRHLWQRRIPMMQAVLQYWKD